MRSLVAAVLLLALVAPAFAAQPAMRPKWNAGRIEWFMRGNSETVLPFAPFSFYDDFVTPSLVIPAAASEESGVRWSKKIVSSNSTVAGVADAAFGQIKCALASNSEKEDAWLYQSDERNIDLAYKPVIEFYATVSTTPTGNGIIRMGLAGDWADGPDAITYSVWFEVGTDLVAYANLDDNATDQNVTTSTTLVEDTWYLFRIDCTDLTDVKFFIDGNRVAASTTFAYDATGANAHLQPFFGLYKASGTGVGDITLDYVRIWSNRQ